MLEPSDTAKSMPCNRRGGTGEPLWLAVGRLVYYKGLHNAVKALPAVPGRLMVIGEGPAKPELQRLAAAEGVADRIIWRGHVSEDELIGSYHAATALWFPSNARSEGFGLVQVEAMASGGPIVCTAIPASGVAWVSRHAESGLTSGGGGCWSTGDCGAESGGRRGAGRPIRRGGGDERAWSFLMTELLMGQEGLQLYPPDACAAASSARQKKRAGDAVQHLTAGNLFGGIESSLLTIARYSFDCPGLEPNFGLCFEGRLSNELRALSTPVHQLGTVRISRPWTLLRYSARLADGGSVCRTLAVLAITAVAGRTCCLRRWYAPAAYPWSFGLMTSIGDGIGWSAGVA